MNASFWQICGHPLCQNTSFPLSPSLSSCLHTCFPPSSFPSLQNVVVVSSQPAPTPVIIAHYSHAPDYLTLTIVGFVLCFFCGAVAGMLLLIPALICSIMVSIVLVSQARPNQPQWGSLSLSRTGKGLVTLGRFLVAWYISRS